MGKYFGIAGCVLLFSFYNIYAQMPDIYEICAAKYNVSIEERNPWGYDIPYKVKCYKYCWFEAGLLVDENGQFQYELIRHSFDDAEDFVRVAQHYLADKCQNSTIGFDDPCEASLQLSVCYDNAIADYNLIKDLLV